MSLTARLGLVAALIVASQIAVVVVARGYKPSEILVPAQKLAALPRQLGDWESEDVELDEMLVRAIGAHDVISRRYQHADGTVVSVHCAVMTEVADGVGHGPEYCYPGAGWSIIARKDEKIGTTRDAAVARKMTVEQNVSRAQVVYWWRMGNRTFVDRASFKQVRQDLFGQKKWPAAIKVMLHVNLGDTQQAESRVVELAELVDQWTQDLAPATN